MAQQSSIVGLQNLHYAIVIKDDATGTEYGAVKPLAPLINATVSTEVSTTTQYADNRAIEVASAVGATTLSLELANISNEVLVDLLGLVKDENGVIQYTNIYNAPYVAIMFEGTKANSERRMVVLYKGQFQYGEDAYATKTDNAEPQSKSIEATFVSRHSDGKIKAVVDSDDTGVNQTVITNWYNAVYDGAVQGA